jgi:DNA-binding NarL/FixJ family response regulator
MDREADLEPPEPPTIGVLVVDDDPLVRAGLVMMLGGTTDIWVVAEAGDGTQVLPMADRYAPDVVLMDTRMPNMDGLAATEALRARRNAPEVIILTTFDADEHVLRALRAGAAGFVLKDTRRPRSSTPSAGSPRASRSSPRRSPAG